MRTTFRRKRTVRIENRDGRFVIHGSGQWYHYWRDPYHLLLTIPWIGFFGIVSGIYLVINALFALAYVAGGDCLEGGKAGSFADAFFFSVQTLGSIGYGAIHPKTFYAFKLSGTQQQYCLIDEAIRTVLFVRNSCVRYWMDNAKIGKYDLSALCKALSKEFSFANKLNSMARQASAERAWSSISRFYENCQKRLAPVGFPDAKSETRQKIKGKKGYPKFKRRGNSVEYKTSGWALSEDRKHLALTDGHNIGRMKLVGTYDLHYYQVEQIKRVRLVRRADGYYAQFLIKAERNIDTTPTGKTIGLDVGLNHFYTDSNGEQVENPRFLRKSEKSIERLQKRVSRKFSKARKQLVGSPDQKEKIKQSNNYSKAKNKLSRKHLKVSRQRKDHAVKLARCVVASNDVVVYEDLRVANMVKNRKLAKSISDASWYQFRVWIEYFGRIFGRTTIAVAPQYTSQDCSNCGKRVQKTLSTRTHKCPHCGYTADRDENAAINILKKGIATAGHVGSSGLDRVNAWGDLSSTVNDVNQSQQDRSLNQESPDFFEKQARAEFFIVGGVSTLKPIS